MFDCSSSCRICLRFSVRRAPWARQFSSARLRAFSNWALFISFHFDGESVAGELGCPLVFIENPLRIQFVNATEALGKLDDDGAKAGAVVTAEGVVHVELAVLGLVIYVVVCMLFMIVMFFLVQLGFGLGVVAFGATETEQFAGVFQCGDCVLDLLFFLGAGSLVFEAQNIHGR